MEDSKKSAKALLRKKKEKTYINFVKDINFFEEHQVENEELITQRFKCSEPTAGWGSSWCHSSLAKLSAQMRNDLTKIKQILLEIVESKTCWKYNFIKSISHIPESAIDHNDIKPKYYISNYTFIPIKQHRFPSIQ